jgi:type II secretory pathway pseudopilin PulG
MKTPRRGFALVSTLAVLVMVVILITAFVTTMRTERQASHNYSEHKQAQSLAHSVLNRLIAENTAPILTNGVALKPYTLNTNDGSQLPDDDTKDNYLADPPQPGIYGIEPQSDISTTNHLVRLSRAAQRVPAFNPAAWSYLRLDGDVFLPRDNNNQPTEPDWIEYSLPDGTVVGQVAFAIWREDGKFDVNLAGADPNLNGMAPHNLEIERLATNGAGLVSLLDGTDGIRQRNNFSLRRISSQAQFDSIGDDHRVFSIEELLRGSLIDNQAALRLTTFSRDFDVRPEWDGVRDHATAQQFLRSYVNNPDLYMLMSGAEAGTAGPALVQATLNEKTLRDTLISRGFTASESWMQIMRLVAALRLSIPPYQKTAAPAANTALGMESWTDQDIWGIALNIVQASDARSDQNLVAWNRAIANSYEDPNSRTGIRIGPFVTEVAVKLTRTGTNTFTATEYIEMWNPYAEDLQTALYNVGETTGNRWPSAGGSLWSNTGVDGTAWRQLNVEGPAAGGFKTVTLGTRTIILDGTNKGVQAAGEGFRVRFSPFIADAVYSGSNSREYQISKGPLYSNSNAAAAQQFPYQLTAWIPEADMPAMGQSVWYSYQIDDPRMGPFTRYSANRSGAATTWPSADPGWSYSWQGYFNQHSLAGISDGPKTLSVFGDGYNANFGDNWPASWPKNSDGLKRALATFALPGRPFRSVSELGNVFAFRPWRTLAFAATTAPEHGTIPQPEETAKSPMALFDYLTTLGTATDSQALNYKIPPGANTGGFVTANVNLRRQDKRWLFEKVDGSGEPAGPLRPIRGRVNLNSADVETLTTLLNAPYRLVNSLGLQNWTGLDVDAVEYAPDLKVRIAEDDARTVAEAIVNPSTGVRPLRALSDLARLDEAGILGPLYAKYPKAVVDAMMGRLAQFGTIRQQIYTFDILARTLHPEAKKKGKELVTSEVRLLARVYFDTFSRKAFVESVEYR